MILISASAALLLSKMGVDAKHPQIYYQLSTTTENLLTNEFAYLDQHIAPPHHWDNRAYGEYVGPNPILSGRKAIYGQEPELKKRSIWRRPENETKLAEEKSSAGYKKGPGYWGPNWDYPGQDKVELVNNSFEK